MAKSPSRPGGGRQVWVTRTAPFAEATGAALGSRGYRPVIRSLLQVRALPVPEMLKADGLIFTSRQAVRLFSAVCPQRWGPVFTVGDATRDEALDVGFRPVLSANGNVKDLAQLLFSRAKGVTSLLHPCASEPAGDLAREMREAGLDYRSIPLYETIPASLPSARSPLRQKGVAAVLLYSPKAAICFSMLDCMGTVAPGAVLVCLSPAVASAVGKSDRVSMVAAAPTEQALFDALEGALA